MEEMTLSEEKVLSKLNAVSTAKRLASMVRLGTCQPNAMFLCGIGTARF